MSTRWFYSRGGQTQGPLSGEEMKALAADGRIGESDLVWSEDSDPEKALSARAVLEIAKSAAGELPDWLDDVRKSQRIGPLPPPEPCHDLPEWIEDLRVWIALDAYGPAIPWDYSLGPPPLERTVSREVENWFLESPGGKETITPATPVEPAKAPESARTQPATATSPTEERVSDGSPVISSSPQRPSRSNEHPPPASATPASSHPCLKDSFPPQATSEAPVGDTPEKNVPMPPTVRERAAPPVSKPPPSAAPAAAATGKAGVSGTRAEAKSSPSPGQPEKADHRVPSAAPSQQKKTKIASVRRATSLLVEQALEVTGFDARTGQVVHADRFQRWKKEQAGTVSRKTKLTNASLMETFRKARTQIETWLDEEANRPLILALDLEAIRNHPHIHAILQTYDGYGPIFRDKLLRHLDFMAENRCKYYTARPGG